jgi:hypothetical protein
MANINGIPVENITNINGVEASSIQSIVGIPTTSIPDWPGVGPTCTDILLAYGEAPGASCVAYKEPYDFDSTNNLLYQSGYCGNIEYYAAFGFYANEDGNIYQWADGKSGPSWTYLANCFG